MRSRILLALPALTAAWGITGISCGGDGEEGLDPPAKFEARVLVELDPPAVHVTWMDIANEAGYVVERKDGSGAFRSVADRAFDITSYHDSNVQAGTTYSYRVAGVDEHERIGRYSAEITVTIP
jgi:hypothetical protein